MIYTLMHKNIPVLDCHVSSGHRFVTSLGEIYHPDHIPLNIQYGTEPIYDINEFIKHRAVPQSRKNIYKILHKYDAANTIDLSMKSYQVSMSDQYWFKPKGESITWNEVNFYHRPFLSDSLYLGYTSDISALITPNSSLNGTLPQMWIRRGSYYLLLKGGTIFNQQPFNEVYVSQLLDIAHIDHVSYHLELFQDKHVSVCQAFTDETYEFIPAWHLGKSLDKSIGKYQDFIQRGQHLGIPDVQRAIDHMLAIDYVTVNDDRHYGNFGLIRNAETLEVIKMAPIFDNGNTFGYDKVLIDPMQHSRAYPSLPFKDKHDKQIKLIQSHLSFPYDDWIQLAKDTLVPLYTQNPLITKERAESILQLFIRRVERLQMLLSR